MNGLHFKKIPRTFTVRGIFYASMQQSIIPKHIKLYQVLVC